MLAAIVSGVVGVLLGAAAAVRYPNSRAVRFIARIFARRSS